MHLLSDDSKEPYTWLQMKLHKVAPVSVTLDLYNPIKKSVLFTSPHHDPHISTNNNWNSATKLSSSL